MAKDLADVYVSYTSRKTMYVRVHTWKLCKSQMDNYRFRCLELQRHTYAL